MTAGKSAVPTCSRCGQALGADAPEGLCPRCLLALNLAAPTEASGDEPSPHGTVRVKPPPPPPVAEIARHFPQLEILACLGRGGMGVVYQARQKRLNRLVALKLVAPEKERDPAFADRFAREAEALARLSHPNIVTVHDFGEANGLFYLLMEFVDGVSLRQLLREDKLTPEQALAIVPKICEALQYAHEHGIVHRDIKPENLLVDRQGRVKIADFGIAKLVGRAPSQGTLTADRQVVGTPHYMAPEQVEQPQTVDHRADIYSLGVVFYEMLTGELPLGKFQPPSHKVEIDVRLDEIVLKALAKEPERRYQQASQVKSDVETVAQAPRSGTGITGTGFASKPAAPPAPGATSGGRNRPPRDLPWVRALRWSARLLGTAMLLFYGVFVVAEGLPAIGAQPAEVQFNFAAIGLMLAGFLVGWGRDGTAALLIAGGWVLWHISEGQIHWNLFQAPLPVGLLYAVCWWARHGYNTRRVAVVAAALAVFLGVGLLFSPTNVFVNGTVVDAASGQPVAHAELRLPSRGAVDGGETTKPNARADAAGRFRLYLGWYAPDQRLLVTAPGYVALATNLGTRTPGRREVQRQFALMAANVPVPPVVVRTVPAAGAADVDPALTEIRVTFSQPMQDGSWSWAVASETPFPEMTGAARYLADERTCVLPVKLQPGRTYAVWLNSEVHRNFRSRSGQAAVPYLLIFETRK